ncbi:MAG: helix-turn-helix domain-containing protein [Thermomicrobiales bacterium]
MHDRVPATVDDEDLNVIHGTNNPFADLELPNAVERNVKVQLAHAIRNAVELLPQRQAAAKAGIAQSDLSNILRGRVTGFSIERLLKVLANLEQDIDISIGPKRGSKGAISVQYGANVALPISAIQRR